LKLRESSTFLKSGRNWKGLGQVGETLFQILTVNLPNLSSFKEIRKGKKERERPYNKGNHNQPYEQEEGNRKNYFHHGNF
jgi:hypothetical protein